MIKLFLIIIFSISFVILNAQEKQTEVNINKDSLIINYDSLDVKSSVDRQEWGQHLTHNLQEVLEHASRKGIKKGTYIIKINFIVEPDGSISNIHALNNPGYGLVEGCVKVLMTGPVWNPGIKNGKKVRSYQTEPMTFMVE